MNEVHRPTSMSDDPALWQTHASETAFRNRWVTVALDDVVLPTGTTYEYTRVNVNGVGVAVIGFNAAGEVLLEREYRHGVGEVIWQLPGGLAEPGEELMAAALRELREETGFAPAEVNEKSVRYLGSVWDNPGLGAGESHFIAAWGLVDTGHVRRDPAEFVTLHWRSLDWLRDAIRTGEIKERTIVAAVAHILLERTTSME